MAGKSLDGHPRTLPAQHPGPHHWLCGQAWPFLTVTFEGENLSVWSGAHPDNHITEFLSHLQTSPL